jgi:hypothetical protein
VLPNAQDTGPYRVDLVTLIWGRISRSADALHGVGAIAHNGQQLGELVQAAVAVGQELVAIEDLTRTLRVLAAQDGMHAGDWLRSRAVEAQMPRRKPPAALDLQIRLRGLQCRRLVAKLITRTDDEDVTEAYRVTIVNTRGDVASVESSSFANALEGAIAMAGARADQEDL